jgi:ribosomal-protein-alanine N-acetyltransferase
MIAPPVVRTRHLTGRLVREDDLAYVIESDSDIRIQRWLFGTVQTEQESRERLARWMQGWRDAGIGFWIFSDMAGTVVGHGGLFRSPREEGEIEVGYALKPTYWGQGFATEITRLSLEVGFEHVGLRRIIGIAQAANIASRRVMEKCGMVFEAQLPSPDGIDAVRYAIGTTVSPTRAVTEP